MALRCALLAVASAGVLAAGGCRRAPGGPAPAGEKVLEGVVLHFDVSDDARTVVAERRGRKRKAGDLREQVAIVPRPGATPEDLGRGSMLGEVSGDGRWAVWLASKERSQRMGPVRFRAVDGGDARDGGTGMPPFLFVPGGDAAARAVYLTSFQASTGVGALTETGLPDGRPPTPRLQSVPPDGYFALADGAIVALQRPASRPCRALVLPPEGAAVPIADELDCADARLPLSPDGGRGALLRRAPDAHGRRALLHWRPGATTRTIAPDADAWALTGDGVLWWAATGTAGTVGVGHRPLDGDDGPPAHETLPGRFVRGIHPVPGGGVWILLADRACDESAASTRFPACLRFAGAGGAPAPPATETIRRVAAAEGGWPIALFVGGRGEARLVALTDPALPIGIGARARAVAFSPDGDWVAARMDAEDGEEVVLAHPASGRREVLSRGAPEPGEIRWVGPWLFHAWRDRRRMSDGRNGLYRVRPSVAGAPAATGDASVAGDGGGTPAP